MSGSNSLPGPESHGETTGPRTERITPGNYPGARRDELADARTAPCFLNQRETSGDGENWPGSPCLIELELCLTCGAKTKRGKRMVWRNGRPMQGTETLPGVWRDEQGHDEWCESYWDQPVGRYGPCGCVYRVLTGAYPDGRRSPG
jgi:hypothetical protein